MPHCTRLTHDTMYVHAQGLTVQNWKQAVTGVKNSQVHIRLGIEYTKTNPCTPYNVICPTCWLLHSCDSKI